MGAGLTAVGVAANDELNHPKPLTTYDPNLDSRMRVDQGVGLALLGVGGAALVAGVVVAIVGARRNRHLERASRAPDLVVRF